MLIRFDSPAPEHMWTLDQGNPFGKAVIDCKDWDTVLGYLRRLYSMPSPRSEPSWTKGTGGRGWP